MTIALFGLVDIIGHYDYRQLYYKLKLSKRGKPKRSVTKRNRRKPEVPNIEQEKCLEQIQS